MKKNDTPTILIVDDDKNHRHILNTVLTRNGYKCMLAESGTHALHLVEKNDINLIVLDYLLPDLTGFEVLSLVRDKYNKTTLPIIILTGNKNIEDVKETIERGANEYLFKPTDNVQLIKKIKKYIKNT
jgi:DNA-binding response OmpR family regulator